MGNKDDKVKVEQYGMGFFGWLTLLFIGLKLTGYIEWSWLWVLSPLWIPILFLVITLGFFLAAFYPHKQKDKK
jgi:hypothetical protein